MPAPNYPPFPGLHPPQSERCPIDEAPGDKGVSLRHRVTWGGAGLQKSIPRILPSPKKAPYSPNYPSVSVVPQVQERTINSSLIGALDGERRISAGDKCLTSTKTETSSCFEGHWAPCAPSPLRSASTHTGSLWIPLTSLDPSYRRNPCLSHYLELCFSPSRFFTWSTLMNSSDLSLNIIPSRKTFLTAPPPPKLDQAPLM